MANRFFQYPWNPWILKFHDPQKEQSFINWAWPFRRNQMRLATVGAGFLYCIYALVDRFVLTDHLQFALSIHLFVNLPVLLCACALSFFSRFDRFLPVIVALTPIVCILGNLFIVDKQGATALYLPEPYLVIMWVYTTSGLRFTHANITALIISALISGAMMLMFQLPPEKLFPHTYWLMVSLFLGSLGCYLLERSSRINFLITEKLREEVLERKKAKDNITRRARWAEGLQKASQDLSLCRHIEEIARVTSRSVVEQLGLTNAWVGVHSQDGSIQPLSVYGGSGNLIQKEGENCQIKVVRTGQSIVISDVEADPPFENCPAYAEQCHFGSCATFPISAGEKCVGTLTIRSSEKGDLAGVAQIAPMIETLVQQVGHVWQRCLAEENLKKLSRAIESSPVSVVITDTNGTIEYVNSKFNEVTGYTVEEAVGQNPRVFKSGDLPKSYYKELWDTILSGKVWRGRFINKRKNGEDFWESASISPIMDEEGEITHFVAVKQDITERKHMEQEILAAKEKAEEATRAKSDFLANMSHEIRTPMNAVIGMAHLALKTELTPKQKDYLNKIQSSANSLLGIINDILDFSKIEAGKLDMESVEFNLDDVLDNLANLVTVKAQEKEDLEVLFATAQEVPRFLVGDPLRLGQVLINLANNAVKFTDSGEIVVATELSEQDETGLTIKFSVKDTGIGLTKEQIGKLFQSFSQADTSTTRKFGGTGLGLTISKRLVEMMGGEIWVESQPGQGTTFSFTANFGLGKETVIKRLVPSSDLRGMKVLVVDDSATSRNILQDILESFSFEVTKAASAYEGLEEIQKADTVQPYELVLMDWKMPGLDGLAASEQIKNHQALSKIPAIILVTAYGREELMQQAEQIGLEGFLIKPVSPSVLFDTIMHAFGKGMPKKSRVAERNKGIGDLKDIEGAQVLLVEDNEINQQVAMEILQGAGLIVTLANDGQQGLDAAKKGQYDAILMDIQMPVMDGYTATRKIREWEIGSGKLEFGSGKREVGSGNVEVGKEKSESRKRNAKIGVVNKIGKDTDLNSDFRIPTSEFKGVPIIAMTAHAMAGDEQKSIAAGMDDHVTKPIDPDQLFSTLQKWIRPIEDRVTDQSSTASEAHAAAQTVNLAENQLPRSLAGFDLAEGLHRLQGNQKLYKKLLLDFAANYSEAAEEIRKCLAGGDLKQAHHLVHNLKGLAGNLAATIIHSSAVDLEKLIKNVDPRHMPSPEMLEQKVVALDQALNQALGSVQTLDVALGDKPVQVGLEKMAVLPVELAQDTARRIRNAAETGDVMQLVAIAEALKSQSEDYVPLSDNIIQLAQDFDFDGIGKIAGALESIL